ncbi:MAG: DUF2079 domain-containing protein [Candidatus Omnitrophota bacterium]
MAKFEAFFEKWADKLLWAFIAVFVLFFSWLSYGKYLSFGYTDWDFASDIIILWNSLHGKLLYYPFLEQNIFGAHLYLILFLILPIYAVFTHPATLLVLQSLFLGLAAWPLYLVARIYLPRIPSLAIGLAYLLYPSVGYINVFETHFEIYEIFFLLFAFYFFEKKRLLPFLTFLVLTLTCKENASLVVFMFGFYGLLRRRPWPWVFWPAFLGAAWFYLAVKVVIPFFARDKALYQEGFIFSIYYKHLGSSLGEMARTVILEPGRVLRIALTPEKISYLTDLFGGAGFFPLLAPGALLMTIPVFLQNLLSVAPSHAQVYFQYTALLIPFLFIASVFAFKRLFSVPVLKKFRYCFVGIFLAVAVFYQFLLQSPQLFFLRYATAYCSYSQESLYKERLVGQIPPQASTMATFQFLPHLAHRHSLHSFHFVTSGYKMYTLTEYTVPAGLEYALINFSENLILEAFYPPQAPQRVRLFLEKGWKVKDAFDDIVLFERSPGSPMPLCELLPLNRVSPQRRIQGNFDGQVELIGYDVREVRKEPEGEVVHLVFYWKTLEPREPWFGVALMLPDASGGEFLVKVHNFGYAIFPAGSWPREEALKEDYYLLLPPGLSAEGLSLKMSLLSMQTGILLEATQAKDGEKKGMIDLGNLTITGGGYGDRQ